MTTRIKSTHIPSLLDMSKGTFVSVTFTKKDGTERVLNGRMGVKAYLKGTDKRKFRPHNLVVMWDAQKKAYRSFTTETVSRIKMMGEEYHVTS